MAQNISLASEKKPRGGRRFEAGKSGNPIGRPKRTPDEIDLIAACRAKSPAALAVIERLMHESEKDAVRLHAAMHIIERAWGKPTQQIDANVTGGVVVEIIRFGYQDSPSK